MNFALPPLLALSDAVTLQIVASLFTFLTASFSAVMAYLINRLNVQQAIRAREAAARDEAAATRTEAVRQAVDLNTRLGTQKLDEVKAAVDTNTERGGRKLDDLAVVAAATKATGEKVHTLVNSAMSIQLQVSAMALRRIADLTRDPADLAAAELAERKYQDHEAKQRIVDAGGGPPA